MMLQNYYFLYKNQKNTEGVAYCAKNALRNRGTTPAHRVLLDNIGFSWEKNYSKEMTVKTTHITKDWRAQVQKIKELHLQGVNVNNISTENLIMKKTRSWVVSQQKRFRSDELKKEQIKLLEDAGIILEKISKQDQRWLDFYDLLVLFKQENGHCRVTMTFDEEFRNWIGFQRTAYKEKILDPKKIEKLNELGFDWSVENKTRQSSKS
jgi:hypothetical protein